MDPFTQKFSASLRTLLRLAMLPLRDKSWFSTVAVLPDVKRNGSGFCFHWACHQRRISRLCHLDHCLCSCGTAPIRLHRRAQCSTIQGGCFRMPNLGSGCCWEIPRISMMCQVLSLPKRLARRSGVKLWRITMSTPWWVLFSILAGCWFGTFSIFPYIGNNHPNWLIFFRWVETTNQLELGEVKPTWNLTEIRARAKGLRECYLFFLHDKCGIPDEHRMICQSIFVFSGQRETETWLCLRMFIF